MKHRVIELGRKKLVLIVTLVSVFMAIVSDFTIAKILGHNILISEDLLRAAIIPLLIAPFVSWYLLGLLFELEKLEKKMSELATFDDLTKVYNRRSFHNICECLHNYSLRNKEKYSFLVIDLDHFKNINDEYGHAAGDKVLESFGKISQQLSRKSDVLGRIGGEEFAFFLSNTDKKHAGEFSNRLRQILSETHVVFEESCIQFTVSIGIFIYPCDETISFGKVMQNADKALYVAKKSGRNQISFYSS